jgi:CO/xanthine dehydrogenase FAD-binding subunit
VKPAPFACIRAVLLDQTIDLLARHCDKAHALAAGRSLIRPLNLCLSAPTGLIDSHGLEALPGSRPMAAGRRAGSNRTARLEVTGRGDPLHGEVRK